MKDFMKYIMATVVGICLVGGVVGCLGVVTLIGIASANDAAPDIQDNSVLLLKLSGVMEERAEENPWSMLGGDMLSTQGLDETLTAIRKAKTNACVKGIYIEAGAFTTDFASLQEIRNALVDFKKSGKWIVAYADFYTQGAYYLSSVADKLYLNPQGKVDWHGLCAEPIFVKDLLAKVGIRMQVVKVGKYKSATEMFTEDCMSEPNRQQVQAYINSLWNNICKEVAASRKLTVAQLNTYADGLLTFEEAQALKQKKMVDGLLYTDQVKGVIQKLLKEDDFHQVTVTDMAKSADNMLQEGEQIAVYYAYGDIVDTPVEGSIMGGSHQIVANEVCKDLRKLADDDDVKAVVIRINSGGGSAYASEQLWHEVEMLKTKKPVVVSMGGMAASGGYYMSCNANWIVAQPTTLTGSIGIFGMIPDCSQLLTDKLGIKYDQVKTNRHADMGTASRPMNNEEVALLTAHIERGYALFRNRVANGRKLSVEKVEELAQGHVFTGEDALQKKLVDELGGLDKAVVKAAALAKLKTYYTSCYPEKSDLLSRFLEEASSNSYIDEHLKTTLGHYYEPVMLLRNISNTQPALARLPFFVNVK